jgi:hypothetical protein
MRTVRGRHYAKFYSRSDDVVIRVYDHCSDVAKVKAASDTYRMSKDRLIQSIALAANCVTILGLLLVILQLRQNRSSMRAQVRHELASTIVDLLNTFASNSQLASVVPRAGLGEQLTATLFRSYLKCS